MAATIAMPHPAFAADHQPLRRYEHEEPPPPREPVATPPRREPDQPLHRSLCMQRGCRCDCRSRTSELTRFRASRLIVVDLDTDLTYYVRSLLFKDAY